MFILPESILKLNVLNNFNPFKKEGGKLPSFLISFNHNDVFTSTQKSLIGTIGDYSFYKQTSPEIKIWITFQGVSLCLDNEYSSALICVGMDSVCRKDREIIYLLMQAYMYSLVNTGNLMIHAAAVEYNNEGILFCGKSGAGKSTQANLWKKHLHAKILNYDKPCIIEENSSYYVHGSPWSGKEGLYLNEFVTLKAIVFVDQAKENSVIRLSVAQAFSTIYLHNYVYPISQEIDAKYRSVIKKLVTSIPVYVLSCNISETAVETLFNQLFSTRVYSKERTKHTMKYKTKDNFQMDKIADDYIVIPRGKSAIDFNATVVFNETGAFLWDKMSDFIDIDALAKAIADKYSIPFDEANNDVVAFVSKMSSAGLLEELGD